MVPGNVANGIDQWIEEGPILYLQAASDGNELNGISVIQHILNNISPDNLRAGSLQYQL